MACVLACIDLSDVTDRVLSSAARLASALGDELVVLHVAPPDPEFVGYEAGPQSVRDQIAAKLRAYRRQLDERVELAAGGAKARVLMVQGNAVERIHDHAERLAAELIVVGTHGHGRLHKLLVGSVANGVIRASKIPVVIVPTERSGR